jgi:hypothetical protein
MSKKNLRPTFNLDDNEEKPVKAGGIIFYRFTKNDMELLLMESRGMIEDLGGCSDNSDKSICETVAREVDEESNNMFEKDDVMERIEKSNVHIYMKKSKYVVFLLQATPDETKFKSKDFGEIETHDDIPRIVRWIPLSVFLQPEVVQHKINWRLKSNALFNKLKEIKNDKKMSVNLFKTSEQSKSSKSNDSDSDSNSDSDSSVESVKPKPKTKNTKTKAKN